MSAKRTLKKYSNRRLYDPETKTYMTFEALLDLIEDGVEVAVLDAKTGDDLTQGVLIQLILETQKDRIRHLFPSELLHQMIRYRTQSLAEFFHGYLPNLLKTYLTWQQEAQSQFLSWAKWGFTAASPMQREFMSPTGLPFWPAPWLSSPARTGSGSSSPGGGNGDVLTPVTSAGQVPSATLPLVTPENSAMLAKNEEIARLQQRLADMEARLQEHQATMAAAARATEAHLPTTTAAQNASDPVQAPNAQLSIKGRRRRDAF